MVRDDARSTGEDMTFARNTDVTSILVRAVEGGAVYGGALSLKALMQGERFTLLEARYEPGVGAPLHSHTHESIIYVVGGKVRTVVGDEEFVFGPGDAARHPVGVSHTVEAIDASLVIEVKSPPPDLSRMVSA
jgi:quercetin dioxygenase-like cupin family protein